MYPGEAGGTGLVGGECRCWNDSGDVGGEEMAENKSIVTYKKVLKFYFDRKFSIEDKKWTGLCPNEDLKKEQNQAYIKTAKCVNFVSEDDKFDGYAKKVNKEMNYGFDVITREKPISGELFCLTEKIYGSQYYVHKDADDFVFAWIFKNYNEKDYLGEIICNNSKWFIDQCGPQEMDNKSYYNPGQAWHLFEYAIYHLLNDKYKFSALPKKKMEDEFEQRIVFWRLLVWMAKIADIDDKEKIIEDFISNKRNSREIKEAIWEAIRNA